MTPQEMVRQFHEVFDCAIDQPTEDVIRQRRLLIEEEFIEVYDELRFSGDRLALFGHITNLPFVAKELADLAYVVYGAAVALGIDLDKAVALVHESNMSKLGSDGKPILREDGKVLKGPNYFEPDMTEAVQ